MEFAVEPGVTTQASHPLTPPLPEATAVEPPSQPVAPVADPAIPAYEQPAIPRNSEDDTSILSLGNKQRIFFREAIEGEHDMDPLAGAHA